MDYLSSLVFLFSRRIERKNVHKKKHIFGHRFNCLGEQFLKQVFIFAYKYIFEEMDIFIHIICHNEFSNKVHNHYGIFIFGFVTVFKESK